ncbi:hypothetical protein M8J75_003355 [Diaphorina citri]|nr:hypothetical protein M8J75_003355 [Diaphorina citri]
MYYLQMKPNEKITALHIRNISLVRLEVNIPEWRYLMSLSITDGNITQILGILESSHISCLNLSSNYIQETDPLLISELANLVRLDMSNNNMTLVPTLSPSLLKFEIDLSNNKYINCSNILDMMRQVPGEQLRFDNRAQTSCCSSRHQKCGPVVPRNHISLLDLDEVEFIYKISLQCPQGDGWKCDCEYRVIPSTSGEKQRIFLNVDCSNRNLVELPRPLPQETTSLNVSNNNISSLEPVVNEPSYQSLIKLYADMNAIKSIDIFEGSTFINQFEELSLRRNQISVIPTYILSNVFSKSTLKMRVNLGFNRLQCDCNTAQTWLIAHKHHIADVSDLLCSNYKEPVIHLDPTQICVTPRDWTDYIYYIITGEILVFLLLLGKVSYDYWVFRTAGYLPWPANPEIPELLD